MSNIFVKVESINNETGDIRSFSLVAMDGEELPEFSPGSHIDVHTGSGVVRQYSLCGDLQDRSHYQIAIKMEPESRGGSIAMHERVVGDALEISEPRNNFPLNEDASHTILFAGGIGVTPIISMADSLYKLGKSFELHYFTRSPAHTAFYVRLSESAYTKQIHFHYSLNPDEVRAYLCELLCDYTKGNEIYLCGPKPFMDLVENVAAATWPPNAINLEYFSAEAATLVAEQEGFEVTLARTGGTYFIPKDKTIVEALIEEGIDVNYSCTQGVCGTCLTGVLEGIPDHRDMFLSPEDRNANDRICLCVSRAKSASLKLDL